MPFKIKHRLIATIYFFIFSLVCSCGGKEIFPFRNLNEAKGLCLTENKPLFYIIEREECDPCISFLNRLSNEPTIVKMVNDLYQSGRISYSTKEAHRLCAVLNITGTPASLLYNSKGVLIDVIEGASISTDSLKILLLKNVSHKYLPFLRFNSLSLDGQNKMIFYDGMLKVDSALSEVLDPNSLKGDSLLTELRRLVNIKSYFYNNFLLSRFLYDRKDTSWQKFAIEAMSFEDNKSLLLYQEERMFLKKILSENRIDTGPVLFQSKSSINWNDARINEACVDSLKIVNVGTSDLFVATVEACDCIEVEWPTSAISPGGGGQIKIKYIPKDPGIFQQSLYVLSNSVFKSDPIVIKGRAKASSK